MDKLEPILRHKFWIIFGVTLPLALFAYFSASGKMAEATTAQETTLEGAINGVPKGDTEPNQKFAEGAKIINDELQKEFDAEVQKLWEMQTERMTWPKIVVPFVPEKYRGEIDSKARYTYQRVYPGVVERLWERVQPYVGDTKNNRALVNFKAEWPQKVIIDGHKIPAAAFDMSAPASNKEIWDAQEDVWLLEMIFDAVVRTNADAQFVTDAPVRQIDKIELVGGSGESSVTSSGSATGGGSSEDYMGDPSMGVSGGSDLAGLGSGGGRMGGMGGVGGPVKIAFNVAEEFGPQVPEESDETASASSSLDSTGGYDAGYMGDSSMFGGARAGAKMQRYIGAAGFDPFATPYRERGFYMSVIILQDRIPDFLAELSSSPWPIRIGRFHIGENPYAEKQRGTRGGGGFGSGMGMDAGYEDYMTEDYGGGGMLGGFGMGGFGGMGGGPRATLKLPDYMKMPSSIPPELRSHPDLVQMDLCGIITMYNPITSDEVEVTDDGSTEEEFQDELEQTAETPEEAQAMEAKVAAEEAAAAAAAAAEGAAGDAAAAEQPAAPAQDGEAPGEAPAAEAAPPAAEPSAEAPPAEPPAGETPAESPPQTPQ